MFAAALLLLLVSAVFGGASQTNALSLMAVELASLPLLFMSTYLVLGRRGADRFGLSAGAAGGAIVARAGCCRSCRCPSSFGASLPERGIVVAGAERRGPWASPSLPFSLAPQQTWRALLALAPPTAMFLGGLMLSDRQRRVMAALWLVLAVASLGLGALQMLGGPDSALYFYQVTNAGSPVGFFSNRNHQAAFLLCLLPIAAMFAARFDGRFDSPRLFPALAAVLYVFIAIVGVAATRSRAGVVLAAVALAGSAAIVLRGEAVRRHWRAAAALGAGVALAIGGVLVCRPRADQQRFETGGEPRFEGWPIVLRAAQDLPAAGRRRRLVRVDLRQRRAAGAGQPDLGMRRHPASPEGPPAPRRRSPAPHDAPPLGWVDVVEIAEADVGVGKRVGDGRERIAIMVAVVGVEEADRLAAECAKALVHRVVEPAIRLRDDGQVVASKTARDRDRVVGARRRRPRSGACRDKSDQRKKTASRQS